MITLLPYLAVIAVYFISSRAALCNARMDTVDHKFSTSIYKKRNSQWFNPNDKIGGWRLKNPEYRGMWLVLARAFLHPVWFWVAKRLKKVDPFSDYWHYQKFLMKLHDYAAFATALTGCALFGLLWIGSCWIYATYIPLCMLAWSLGWNLNFNRHLKNLRA